MNSKYQLSRRCGWAVCSGVALYLEPAAATKRCVGAQVVAFGPLNGLCQEVPIAELHALLFAVKHAMPDERGQFRFYTDCLWLITSYNAGRISCTDGMHVGAHLWRQLFKLVDDIFAEESCLQLIKVKSHTAFAACLDSPEDTFRWGGNAIADDFAKQGASRHPSDICALEATKVAEAVVTQTALFIARMGVWRWDRYGRPAKQALPITTPSGPRAVKPARVGKHKPCLEKLGRWRCTLCMSSAETLSVLRRWPCIDQDEGQTLQSHKLMQAGDVTFCRVCGYYSGGRTRGLRERCSPITSSSRADRLALLLNGRHPTKYFLIGKPRSLPLYGEWMKLHNLKEGQYSANDSEDLS